MGAEQRQLVHPRIRVGEMAGREGALPEHEKISPEILERRRKRADIPYIPQHIYFNTQAARDTIRHFVHGIGDDNPLFVDEEYARKTKYGDIIAPGSFLYSIQWDIMGGLIAGAHGWYSGGSWDFFHPIFKNDELRCVQVLRQLVEKKGRMAGGKSIYISYGDVIYVNQRNEIVGKEYVWDIIAGRGEAGEAKKERNIPLPVYKKDDWIRFLEAYEKEELRGAEPRWWEDVEVGDRVGPMIKGPLHVRDIVTFLMGAGSPFFKSHKIQYDFERRHPMALEYVKEMNDADIPELVHIFDAYARVIGVERAYDYGCQRMSWLCNLFTNWMGDDGFLWKMWGEVRVFNQVGDVTTFEGKVVKKYIENEKCCVDIEAWAKNQRGDYSMPPRMATVILPSREYGPVVYPYVPGKLVEEVKRARPLEDLRREGLL